MMSLSLRDHGPMLSPIRSRLPNGVSLNLFDMPWARSVCLHFTFLAGSFYETAELNGTAHVLEHVLMQFLSKSDPAYDTLGWYHGSTDVDFIDLGAVTRLEQAVKIVRLLCRAFELGPDEISAELPAAKQSVLHEIASKADLLDLKSDQELFRSWWGSSWHRFNPLGITRPVRSLRPAILGQVAAACLQPSRLIVSLAGAVKPLRAEIESVLAQLTPRFEDVSVRHAEAIQPPALPTILRKRFIEGSESRVMLAFPTFGASHTAFLAGHVIATILSNVERSSLYHRLQHPSPLAYDISCSQAVYRDFSYLDIHGWVRKRCLMPVLRNVLGYLREVAQYGFSHNEFRAGVEKALIELAAATDSPEQVVSLYNQYLALGWIDDPERHLRDLTVDDLNRAAAHVFGAQRPALILFTPRDAPDLGQLKDLLATDCTRVGEGM